MSEPKVQSVSSRDTQLNQAVHKGDVIEALYRAGLEMKRCQLEREHPHLSSEAIEALFDQWLSQPPSDTESWATLTIVNPRLKPHSSQH